MNEVGLVIARNYQYQKNYHLCSITKNEFKIVEDNLTMLLMTAEDVCRIEEVSVLWLAWYSCLKTVKREGSHLHSMLILCVSH